MVRQRTLYLTLIFATFAVSWAAIFIKLSGAGPLANAYFRMAIASMVLIIPFMPKSRQLANLNRREKYFLLFSGVMLAFHFITWITSLYHTTISNSVMLVATSPIFVLILDYLVHKQRPQKRAFAGILIAIIGVAAISGGDIELGRKQLYGNILALAGAVFVAIYFVIGRSLRGKIDNICYITPVYSVAAVVILTAALANGDNLVDFPAKTWLYFGLLALVPMLMGHSLYNWLLKYVPTYKVSTITLGEPIGATILAIIIFNEIPELSTIIGGALILGGIYLVLRRSKP
jgi:drug/metabolite transporter (DMT)-like permease